METTVIDYRDKYTKWLYFTMAGVFFIFAMLCLITQPVEAKIALNSTLFVTHVTEHSISWNYTYLTANRPKGATLDGVEIEGWKTDYIFNYTASELEPNTTHEFCIFGEATSNCEKGTTLPDTSNLNKILYEFGWAILSCALLITGVIIKKQEPALASGLVCFIGVSIVSASGNLIGEIVYAILFIASIIVSFED